MRKNGVKRGALTEAEAIVKAQELISLYGECLFIMDMVDSSRGRTSSDPALFKLFEDFLEECTDKFSEFFRPIILPDGTTSRGFRRLGDAAWTAIGDSRTIPLIIALKEKWYPELHLHYGIAKDEWDEGMILVK